MSEYLVTGGAGFVGSNLVDELLRQGDEVTTIDNLSTGRIENLNPEATFIEGDISDPEIWASLGKFNCVFHVAALPRIPHSIKDPVPGHIANVDGTLQVLEYCRRTDTKIIYSSSSSLYSGEDLPATEDSEINPNNPYTLQKYIGEQYVELYHKLYGLDYATLRYFNVYGERQLLEGAYCTVLGIFLSQRDQGRPLTITSDGEQRRDFTYVGDVVRANVMAQDWTGTFNIGRGDNHSVNEIAEWVGGETEFIPKRQVEVRQTLADNTKAREQGWAPTTDVKDWIQDNV